MARRRQAVVTPYDHLRRATEACAALAGPQEYPAGVPPTTPQGAPVTASAGGGAAPDEEEEDEAE